MTENKPVAWTFEYDYRGRWFKRVEFVAPSWTYGVRNVEPLYRHPQPDADPVVEAARRQALRAIFAALGWHPYRDDAYAVPVHLAVLRDLVGRPRKDPDKAVVFYDGGSAPFGVGGDFETSSGPRHVSHDDRSKPAAPARLSVDDIAAVMSDADDLTFRWSSPCQRMARAVHEAVYGQGE